MENNSRTVKASKNAIISLIANIFQVLLGFIVRKLFITYLGINYLGYNSVFSNILQMLNLADMGIGVAITSFLYKPLAENDKTRIASLMSIYKKLYTIIGIVVLATGLVVSLFLGYLVPDANCSLDYLRLLFYINLIGTVSTYFVAYKRTLIIADQKSYIANITDTCMFFIVSISQIITLILFSNYVLYLCLNIVKNIISNIILSIFSDRYYGYLKQYADSNVVKEYRPKVFSYLKDVFVSRIGAVVYYSTDNVILSVLKGSLLTGYLSNYTLITTQLNAIVSQVLASLQATFGNYISTNDDLEQQRKMTDNYFCVNFCIGVFCFICFSTLVQPFVKLLFGEQMILGYSTAVWLGINLMLTFLIQLPSQVFVIYKLFKYDRPIIITSAVLNIIISVVLAREIGINGVLIGTFATSLIYLFSRFYIIAKYVYKIPYTYYLKRIALYVVISVISYVSVYFITKNINGDGIKNFIFRAGITGVLAITIPTIMLAFTGEFSFLLQKLIPNKLKTIFTRKRIIFASVLSVVFALVSNVFTTGATFKTAGNKSFDRTDSYVIDVVDSKQVFSLSFDDTILLFEDLTENNYSSIFENETLKWCKELHSKYGINVSFFVYYENDSFNLSSVPSKYQKEFINNSDWMRFGFHTIDGSISYESTPIAEDYKKTITQLVRIVGSESIDNVIRLQKFQGSYEAIAELLTLEEKPVGFYTADDNRQSYYLNDIDNKYIYSHDRWYDEGLNLWFYSTDFRTEYVDNINSKLRELSDSSWNNQRNDLVVFSPEWALNIENKEKIEKVCKYAKEQGYQFVFFEDTMSIPTQ